MGSIAIGLVGVAAFILGIGGCAEVFSAIKNRSVVSKIRNKNSLLLYLLTFILCATYLAYDIHRYETMIPDGTYCHYAVVSSDSGSYTLPARVHKISDTEEIKTGYDYLSGERRTVAVTTSAYYISEAYWPNGGYLYFEEDVPLIVGEEYTLHDQNDNRWKVIITETKSNHPEVIENTDEKDWLGYGIDLVVLSGGIIGSFLVLFNYFRPSKDFEEIL